MGAGTKGFKPKRLTQAREVRALTQAALADLLRITRAAVSQYESGQRTPSREILSRLSDVLAIPQHFFVHDDGYEVRNTMFFRSMASATKTARLRATRLYEWLLRIVAYLQDFVDFPEVRIPSHSLPPDPVHLTFNEIERLADATRREMDLGFGPISNVTWLLENKGGIVAELDLHAKTLDAFSNWYNDTPVFVLNRDKGSAVRWRYDLAHELGHMVLHREISNRTMQNRSLFRVLEDQAHYFAGAFLLPESTFGAMVPYSVDLDTLAAIKPKWRVSIAAMVMRLRSLDLISEKKAQRLFIGISRRRWRTREPFDDTLEAEEPQLLWRAADLVTSQNPTSMQDMEACLGIPKEDIQNLLGYKAPAERRIVKFLNPRREDTN